MIEGAALVTGGAQRIGAVLVRRLAARGLDVAIHCNASRDAAEALAGELRGGGVRAAVVQADLLDREATLALVPAAAAALGRPLSVLVNNASLFDYDTIASATAESWDRNIGSNLRAPFELIQAFAAQAPRAGKDAAGEPVARAAVINLIDERVRKLTPEFTTYTIAKMGLWALDPDRGPGARAGRPGERNRPGADAPGGAAIGRAFRRPARGDDPRPGLEPRGDRGGAGFHPRRSGADRAAPLHRRRPAPRLADPRRARG